MQMKLCSLARPPRTSRYAARPLTDHGPVPVHGLGDGDPCINLGVSEASLSGSFRTAGSPSIAVD